MRYIGYVWATAALAVLLGVGIWVGYWKLSGSAADHRNHINQHSQNEQAAIIAQERDRVSSLGQLDTAIAAEHDPAVKTKDTDQRTQIAGTFCTVYADITDVPQDLSAVHPTYCH